MSRRLLLLVFLACGGCQTPADAPRPPAPVGDGTADDTAALQALLDRGGRVALARGVYRITRPLVIDLPKTGFTHVEGGTVARVVMNGDGPAFRFVGTHAGTADPKSVKPGVWERERMPGIDGL
jgi:hypothetical protein